MDYLEANIGIPVKLQPVKYFSKFNDRLSKKHYDLVHLNQAQYIQSHNENGYNVIVQNEEFGQSSIKAAIYSHVDSPINELSDLKGKNIIFGGGKLALVSYIVPTMMLREAGLNEGDYSEKFSVNPPNAVLAAYKKMGDAACAGEVALNLPMVKDRIDVSKLRRLAISNELPHLPWALKGELVTVHFPHRFSS